MANRGTFSRTPFVAPIMKKEFDKIRKFVLSHDRDFVAVYDGEEGVGKSVLAMQHAIYFDPNFNLDNICFTAESFIAKIKDPTTKEGSCIILDEAFNAASSRSSLSAVNKAMIALATEMRQRNLFALLVLPTFFDLDRYFAIWRCKTLFHVYQDPETGQRRYVVFPKSQKKLLYLLGKKMYSYAKPRSPYPPFIFFNEYVVDEFEYRKKKAEAFRKRRVSTQSKKWLLQRNALIRQLLVNHAYKQEEINSIFKMWKAPIMDRSIIGRVNMEIKDEDIAEAEIQDESEELEEEQSKIEKKDDKIEKEG